MLDYKGKLSLVGHVKRFLAKTNKQTLQPRFQPLYNGEKGWVTRLDLLGRNVSLKLCCDVNATCQNTLGSYVCSRKSGFTGGGKSYSGKIRK